MKREQEELIARKKAEAKHIAYMKECGEQAEKAQAKKDLAESKAEKLEEKIRNLYDKYKVNMRNSYQTTLEKHQKKHDEDKAKWDEKRDPQIALHDKIKADIQTYRDGEEEDRFHEFDVFIPQYRVTAPMTKTARFSYAMSRAADFVWTKIFDPTKVSRE